MPESNEIDEKALKLHRDLLAGHLTATAQIAELLLPNITNALKRKFSNIDDEHLIQTAANDAVLYYLKSPSNYDSSRGSLINFVWQRAYSNVLNSLASRKNFSDKEKSVELSDDRLVYSNETDGDETIEQFLIISEQNSETFRQLRELLPDSVDQSVLEAMMDGERETARFAEIIGIGHESEENQRLIVKRCKDRIKKVVHRRYERQSKYEQPNE